MVTVAEARAQELALVARTGPLLQQSLELGDLLPMFVVAVSDELALDSISISLVSDAGQMVRVFSLGTDASPLVAGQSALATPESVGPGEAVTFPLQRAGRVVGALRARTSRGLTGPQVEALVAACNLLAAALGNARLFQDEQEMVARLREVDQLKTTFIGAVSHELNTTLTAIVGFAGLLEADRSMLDATHADYIERLSRNARSLGVLVEDLLDIARIERSSISVALRPTDLSDLVPKVVDQMSSILDGRRVSRIVEPGVTAIADAAAVERILANLLSNAAKYTPVGTAVDVALEREGEMAVISVSDHGPGIPVNEREKVFELFYRANDATSGTRGIGIGLALVRQLAKQLHGTIAVDDTPAGGARFRVKLPIIEAPLASRAFTNQPASSS
jgi:two-component system OmpR family sensor kinase